MAVLYIQGSECNFTVDSSSGAILDFSGDNSLAANIEKFDVQEALSWVRAYKNNNQYSIEQNTFDILSVGFWDRSGEYIPPENEIRTEIENRYK